MTVGAEGREQVTSGRLARLGFGDLERARRLLASPVLAPVAEDPEVLAALGAAADPMEALLGLVGVAEALAESPAGGTPPSGGADALLTALRTDERLRARLVGALGASTALAHHLRRHPEHWVHLAEMSDVRPDEDMLRAELLTAVGADPESELPRAMPGGRSAADALRVAYRRALLGLAARDLSGAASLEAAAGELADLAAATLEAALAIARAALPPDAIECRLAVIGMGKAGGRELNYVSDVDVIFVAEPLDPAVTPAGEDDNEQAALKTATTLALGMMQACSATTPEGTIWPVDAALRPEGKAGPLVRTLPSHLAYYEKWAKTWEFQALLKARPIAGDRDLGERYVQAVAPLVWKAAARPGFVEDVQAMRRRVERSVPRADGDRELKLGRGGLRDIEFAVQLLQLVHGRTDPRLRSSTTLTALEALSTHGYVGRRDAAQLDAAYRFLRTLEHRIQLYRLRRTHLMPEDEDNLRRLGRSMGYRSDPVIELTAAWRGHAHDVRRLHEKLFYRPLLAAVARLEDGDARLTPEAARERLSALGYLDPAGALRHLEALASGVSRRASIQRTLLPVMLGWFADAADPDGGLLAFRRVSDALGSTPWYLRVLRDEGLTAERMAHLLASSRYAADLLLRAPEAVGLLVGDAELIPRDRPALIREVLAGVHRYNDPVAAVGAARAVRRRELFRVAAADLVGGLDVEDVGAALTDVAAATVSGGLEAAIRAIESERRAPLPTRMAVIAMGRFGGHELGYGSDADVLFVHDPLPGADEREASDAALSVALEMRRLLALPAPEPPLAIDADLRPEGRQGPLVRTLGSYAKYYAGWSLVWEAQALIRAEPVAGDERLGEQFIALIDPLRWPAGGLDDAGVREVRRIKARVEAERLPRGGDPSLHMKLGRGGLADVEWTVQLLQLRHAHAVPGLRTTGTMTALQASVRAGLLGAADAATLRTAWRMAGRLRNAVVLQRGRTGDSMPSDARERAGVARIVGYSSSTNGQLVDDYRRVTRRARAVVERVFYA